MENLKEYTETQLLKFVNDAKRQHEEKKSEILKHLEEIKFIEKTMNKKVEDLDEIEKMYVELMKELNNRG